MSRCVVDVGERQNSPSIVSSLNVFLSLSWWELCVLRPPSGPQTDWTCPWLWLWSLLTVCPRLFSSLNWTLLSWCERRAPLAAASLRSTQGTQWSFVLETENTSSSPRVLIGRSLQHKWPADKPDDNLGQKSESWGRHYLITLSLSISFWLSGGMNRRWRTQCSHHCYWLFAHIFYYFIFHPDLTETRLSNVMFVCTNRASVYIQHFHRHRFFTGSSNENSPVDYSEKRGLCCYWFKGHDLNMWATQI